MFFLVPVSLFTLFVVYIVIAAMHDIAHGELDPTFEWTALALSIPAFALLYRFAVHVLPRIGAKIWLGTTAALVLLLDVAAIHALRNPKYPADPMLSMVFLSAGIPLGCFLIRRALSRSR